MFHVKHLVVVHLPNAITVGRMLLAIPVAMALYLGGTASLPPFLARGAVDEGWAFIALVLLVLAMASDGIDGWLARRYGVQSRLGQLLDPVADKLVSGASFLALALVSEMRPEVVVPALAVIVRDVLVSARRLSGQGLAILAPSRVARFKTGLQMCILVLAPALGLTVSEVFWGYVWLGGMWSVAALSVWTGVAYLRIGVHRRG